MGRQIFTSLRQSRATSAPNGNVKVGTEYVIGEDIAENEAKQLARIGRGTIRGPAKSAPVAESEQAVADEGAGSETGEGAGSETGEGAGSETADDKGAEVREKAERPAKSGAKPKTLPKTQ